jgi:selenocysteine lyase/cysteine desulfurase
MAVVEEHEEELFGRLVSGLRDVPGVHLHGCAQRHTPTALFSVAGVAPDDVYRRLAERGVNAPAGNFYAVEASRWIGLGDTGAVRAGLAPYSNDDDVDRLLSAIRDVAVSTASA